MQASLSAEHQQLLLKQARFALEYCVEHKQVPVIDIGKFDSRLQEKGACFVTLNKNNNLRGCIGSLVAHRPLIQDVMTNACSSAVSDKRFQPVQAIELSDITISISVLSAPKPIVKMSETELLRYVRPGDDGLILHEGNHRSTFLPSVWSQLPDPTLFLQRLKLKAGLPEDYWSETIQFKRYYTHNFSE